MVGSGIFEENDVSFDDLKFLLVISPNESQKYILWHRDRLKPGNSWTSSKKN